MYTTRDSKSLSPVTTLGDEIPWQAINYRVNCYQIIARLNSTLIVTVTATSEGLVAPLEGHLYLYGAIITVLHSLFTQYFEPSIAYIFSFAVDIPLQQRTKHRKSKNDIFSILWYQLCVRFPLLGLLVAVLGGCTIGTTWELLSVLWDARGLSDKSGVWWKSTDRCRKLFSPQVQNLVFKLLVSEVRGGCVRGRLGCFVFINQQTTGYWSDLSDLTRWTNKLPELKYIYPFRPLTPPFSVLPVFYTPLVFWAISKSCHLPETTPLVPKPTRQPTQLWTFTLGFLPPDATVS